MRGSAVAAALGPSPLLPAVAVVIQESLEMDAAAVPFHGLCGRQLKGEPKDRSIITAPDQRGR